MTSIIVSLAMTTAKSALALEPEHATEHDLPTLLRTAFEHSNDHGMAIDQDEDNYKGALAAVYSFLIDHDRHEDAARLGAESKAIAALAAASSGIPVDTERMLALMKDAGEEPVGLIHLWHEHLKDQGAMP